MHNFVIVLILLYITGRFLVRLQQQQDTAVGISCWGMLDYRLQSVMVEKLDFMRRSMFKYIESTNWHDVNGRRDLVVTFTGIEERMCIPICSNVFSTEAFLTKRYTSFTRWYIKN